jgi:hypothetical protein
MMDKSRNQVIQSVIMVYSDWNCTTDMQFVVAIY